MGAISSTVLPRPRWRLVTGIGATAASIVLGGLATVSSPASAPSWMSVKCPAGEAEDVFTGVCLPELTPGIVEMTTAEYGGLPEVDGVPCTGSNSYECLGLAEESLAAGPTPSATSTFRGQTETPTSDPVPTVDASPPPTGQDLTLTPTLLPSP